MKILMTKFLFQNFDEKKYLIEFHENKQKQSLYLK